MDDGCFTSFLDHVPCLSGCGGTLPSSDLLGGPCPVGSSGLASAASARSVVTVLAAGGAGSGLVAAGWCPVISPLAAVLGFLGEEAW